MAEPASSTSMFALTPPSSNRRKRTKHSILGSSSRGTFGISSVNHRVGAPPLRRLPLETQPGSESLQWLQERSGIDLRQKTREFLSDYRISEVEIELVERHIVTEPGSAEPTILIITKWHDDDQVAWQGAVIEIKRWVDDMVVIHKRSDLDITIEMIDPRFMRIKYLGPVLNIPALAQEWPTIQAKVRQHLEEHDSTQGHLTSISLFRLGFDFNPNQNPITVYVSLSYDSDEEDWPLVSHIIRRYLDTLDYKLALHLEYSEPYYLAFPLLAPNTADVESRDLELKQNLQIRGEYDQRVNMGSDISASRYITRDDGNLCNPCLGTLGCYVEVFEAETEEWVKVALTNYHVVRPGLDGMRVEKRVGIKDRTSKEDTSKDESSEESHSFTEVVAPLNHSELLITDINGYFRNEKAVDVEIEHPARVKHNDTIHWVNFEIAELEIALNQSISADDGQQHEIRDEIAEARGEKERKTSFFDNGWHVLGSLHAASGNARRSVTNGRLDWALIAVKADRQGENRLPSRDEWDDRYLLPDIPRREACGAKLRAPAGKFERMDKVATDKENKVWKLGAYTGPTAGVYSEFKTDVVTTDDRHLEKNVHVSRVSSECTVFGHMQRNGVPRFGHRGDSGSLVFDSYGRARGLIWGGNVPQQAIAGCTYVTPIEDIFQDIKDFFKGQITDVRVAE